MTYLIIAALLVSHGGAAYAGYKYGGRVAKVANEVKTDVQSIPKP